MTDDRRPDPTPAAADPDEATTVLRPAPAGPDDEVTTALPIGERTVRLTAAPAPDAPDAPDAPTVPMKARRPDPAPAPDPDPPAPEATAATEAVAPTPAQAAAPDGDPAEDPAEDPAPPAPDPGPAPTPDLDPAATPASGATATAPAGAAPNLAATPASGSAAGPDPAATPAPDPGPATSLEPPDQPAPPAADPAADPATGPATGWPAATAPDPAAPATPDPAPQLEPPTGDPAGDPVGTGAGVVHGPGPYPASVTESAAVASGAAEPVPPAVGERTVQLDPGVVAAATADAPAQEPPAAAGKGFWSSGTVLIGLLLALFGFMFVVQLRSSSTDEGLGAARQEDLVRILSDLNAREQRLSEDIRALEETRSRLASGVEGRQEALAQAEKRAQELGLLAGTVPARGPGLLVTISSGSDKPAAKLLNAVQELRGAGGEVMQLTGANGVVVRVVASTAFVDTADGILAGGQKVTGPYELRVIGDPEVMDTALNIPGGVVADVSRDGGTVNTVKRDVVDVTATREPTALRYARPVN